MGWENYYEGHEIEPGPFSGLLGLIFLPLILVIRIGLWFRFHNFIAYLCFLAWGQRDKRKKETKIEKSGIE